MAAGAKGKASRIAVWIILGLLIVGLAGFGATNFGGAVRSVGAVGDTEIDTERYARELNQDLQALRAQTGQNIPFAEAEALGLPQAVLGRLIAEAALEEEAASAGISAGDRQVSAEILRFPAFQGIDGSFDREAYEFSLRQAGLSVAEFEEAVRNDLARSLLRAAVANGIAPSEDYAATLIDYVRERRRMTWARLGPEALQGDIPSPSDADLQAYYEANPDAFMLPETRRITYAWLTPDMMLDGIEVDEDQLRQVYEDRVAQYVQPERRLVERLVFGTIEEAEAARTALEGGETDFETLVADRGLTLDDVDLGDVTETALGSAGPEIFALDAPGIVGPIETGLGPALFRMNGILAAQETPFEEARDQLRDEFAADRARREVANLVEAVDDLLAGGATLEELADETAMALGRIDWTAGTTDGIAAYPEFTAQARAMTPEDFPEVGELSDGGIFAMRIDEIVEPRLEPFEEARPKVAEAWRDAEIETRLAAEAETLVDRIAEGGSFEAAGLQPQVDGPMTREGFIEGTPPDFLSRAFEMQSDEVRVIPADGAVLIVRLDAILPPDAEDPDTAELREALSASLSQGIGTDLLAAFTDTIEAEAGISLNQTAINAVHGQLQ